MTWNFSLVLVLTTSYCLNWEPNVALVVVLWMHTCFITIILNIFSARRFLEVLSKAAPPEPRKLTDKELKAVYQLEEATLRELRLFLRDVINKLGRDRKFQMFAKAVDIEDVGWTHITRNICLFLYHFCSMADKKG